MQKTNTICFAISFWICTNEINTTLINQNVTTKVNSDVKEKYQSNSKLNGITRTPQGRGIISILSRNTQRVIEITKWNDDEIFNH